MLKDGREMSPMHVTMKAGVIHLHLLTFQPTTNNSIHILPKFKLSEMNSYGKQYSKAKKQQPSNFLFSEHNIQKFLPRWYHSYLICITS